MNNNDKKINFIYFFIKLIIIGVILFTIIQLGAYYFINTIYPNNQINTYNEDFIGHYYCGTFFIEMLISRNFKSIFAYTKYTSLSKLPTLLKYFTDLIIIINSFTIIILIFIIFKRIKNKELFKNKTPSITIILGILYLINNLISELSYLDIRYLKDYAKGFLATTTYYPQIYHIFAIPIIIISTGLILKHYELKINNQNTKIIDRIIKILVVLIISVSFIFIYYRLGIRVYELFATIFNGKISIKLPYYGYLMELPYESAISQSGYLKLVILRFIKDFPAFIASIISIILFIKILIDSIHNKINTKINNKRINISLICLFVSSLIFNILGIFEINILHQYFTEPFNNAVYTVGLRSFCEPLLYGLFLYFFKVFINLIPKEN